MIQRNVPKILLHKKFLVIFRWLYSYLYFPEISWLWREKRYNRHRIFRVYLWIGVRSSSGCLCCHYTREEKGEDGRRENKLKMKWWCSGRVWWTGGLGALRCWWVVVDCRMHFFQLCKCVKASSHGGPRRPFFTESQYTFTHILAGKWSKMCICVNVYGEK